MADTKLELDGDLLVVLAQAASFDGDWMCLRDQRDCFGSNIPFRLQITGTCTVTIEGRNTPNDAPVVLSTDAATNSRNLTPWKQFRARVSGVTPNVDVRVSSPYPLRKA